jgi:biotin operon repressor
LEAVHVAAFFNAIDRIADTLGISAQDVEDDIRRMREALGSGNAD